MRRSAHVFAPMLASAALALSGCRHPEPQRCVDEQNHVVDPKFCANLPPGATAQGTLENGGGYYGNHGGGGGFVPIFIPHVYRNYYGGTGGAALGDTLVGGSYTPMPGRSYSTAAGSAGGRSVSSSGTSRGGFGSSFSSSGAHGEGGGGGE